MFTSLPSAASFFATAGTGSEPFGALRQWAGQSASPVMVLLVFTVTVIALVCLVRAARAGSEDGRVAVPVEAEQPAGQDRFPFTRR